MWIRQNNQDYAQLEEIKGFLDPCGIEHGQWPVDQFDPSLCQKASINPAYQQVILNAFEQPLVQLKAKHGYLTEDIVSLSSAMPNLEQILDKFKPEHHHTDDEVRIVLYGNGIFGVAPSNAPAFEIHVSAGDLIIVPAYTRHWFTLKDDQEIVALRVFKTVAGWEALYNKEPQPLETV